LFSSGKKCGYDNGRINENFHELCTTIEEFDRDDQIRNFLLEFKNADFLKNFQLYLVSTKLNAFPYELFIYSIAHNLKVATELFLSNESTQIYKINPVFLTKLIVSPSRLKTLGIIFENQYFSHEIVPTLHNIKELSLTLKNSAGPGLIKFFKQLGELKLEILELANVSTNILDVVLREKYFRKLVSLDASIVEGKQETIENILRALYSKKHLSIARFSVKQVLEMQIEEIENSLRKLKYHPNLRYIRAICNNFQITRNGFHQDPVTEIQSLCF